MAALNEEDVIWSELLWSADTPDGLPSPLSVVADRPALGFRKVYRNACERERCTNDSLVDLEKHRNQGGM